MSVNCRTCIYNSGSTHISETISYEGARATLCEILASLVKVQIEIDDELPQQICDACKALVVSLFLFGIECKNADTFWREKLTENVRPDMERDVHSPKPQENNALRGEAGSDEQQFKCVDVERIEEQNIDVSVTELCTAELEATSPNKGIKHSNKSDTTCPQCGKVYKHKSSMLTHFKKHTTPLKPCRFCTYVPSKASEIGQHMEECHSEMKKLSCPTCGKKFFKRPNLRAHMLIHSGVKEHTCEMCGRSFTLSGNLAIHRRLHTGERPFKCSDCGKGFKLRSALKSHEACHTDRKDYACPDCGAAYSRLDALRSHRKRHASTRRYECPLCEKSFAFSADRKRHMVIHTGVKNHECDVCGRRFNRGSNLKVHRKIHTGETPFMCELCGKRFIQSHCLKAHMKTHGVCDT